MKEWFKGRAAAESNVIPLIVVAVAEVAAVGIAIMQLVGVTHYCIEQLEGSPENSVEFHIDFTEF